MKIVVGGTAEDDAAAFLDAVERADRREPVHERVLSFQGWKGLASALTGGRHRLLRQPLPVRKNVRLDDGSSE